MHTRSSSWAHATSFLPPRSDLHPALRRLNERWREGRHQTYTLFVCCLFCLVVFRQFDVLRQYLDGGGSVLMLLGEGGETKLNTNVNFLLEEYGIMVNNGTQPTANISHKWPRQTHRADQHANALGLCGQCRGRRGAALIVLQVSPSQGMPGHQRHPESVRP